MRPLLLHLDGALAVQSGLAAAGEAAGAAGVEAQDLGPALRLWARPPALNALRRRLADAPAGPLAVFMGSGDFHNVTPLLLERALRHASDPVTVVHFDNHPDWVKFERGIHCGSWVGAAARLPGVKRIVTVGVCSPDIAPAKHAGAEAALVAQGRLEIYPWRDPVAGAGHVAIAGAAFPTVEALGEAAVLDLLDRRVGPGPIYLTLDKDVLAPSEAATNWDQGRASLKTRGRVVVETRTDIDDVIAEIMPIYAATRDRAELAFEDLTPAYFTGVMHRMPGRAVCTLYSVDNDLMAANLMLHDKHVLIDKFFCMKPEGREHNLYYLSWFENLKFCLDHGIARYQSGQAAYANKLKLGSGLTPNAIWFRHRNPILNGVLRWAAPLLAADPPDAPAGREAA